MKFEISFSQSSSPSWNTIFSLQMMNYFFWSFRHSFHFLINFCFLHLLQYTAPYELEQL